MNRRQGTSPAERKWNGRYCKFENAASEMRLAIHGEDFEPGLFIGQGWASVPEGLGKRIASRMAMNEEKGKRRHNDGFDEEKRVVEAINCMKRVHRCWVS